MQRKCKIWQNGYPQTRVVESFKYCIMNITPVNIAVCNQKGSVQQNAGDGNPQGSPSGDSHGLADSHLRCLIPCRREKSWIESPFGIYPTASFFRVGNWNCSPIWSSIRLIALPIIWFVTLA